MWEQNQPIALISIHAPTRGATCWGFCFNVWNEFQSTLLQEERQRLLYKCYIAFMISIHAPTRGATKYVILKLLTMQFQSTLLQEERQL